MRLTVTESSENICWLQSDQLSLKYAVHSVKRNRASAIWSKLTFMLIRICTISFCAIEPSNTCKTLGLTSAAASAVWISSSCVLAWRLAYCSSKAGFSLSPTACAISADFSSSAFSHTDEEEYSWELAELVFDPSDLLDDATEIQSDGLTFAHTFLASSMCLSVEEVHLVAAPLINSLFTLWAILQRWHSLLWPQSNFSDSWFIFFQQRPVCQR